MKKRFFSLTMVLSVLSLIIFNASSNPVVITTLSNGMGG